MAKGIYLIIIMDIIFGSSILYNILNNSKWIVNTKYIIFSNFTDDLDYFNSRPKELYSNNFKSFSLILKDDWLSSLKNVIPDLENNEELLRNTGEVHTAKNIVLTFIKNGADYCSEINSLHSKLQKIYEGGHGCCTDHSQSFLVYSSFFNLDSREVHTVNHVTAEFFDHLKGKWIWIDPLYAIMAKNSSGEYMSLSELRDSYFNNGQIIFDYFGKNTESFSNNDPYLYTYYDSKDDFSDIMVTWGNNVFEEDEFTLTFSMLPKSLRQFIGIQIGVLPNYLKFVDANSSKSLDELIYIKNKYLILMVIFSTLNIVLIITIIVILYRRLFVNHLDSH